MPKQPACCLGFLMVCLLAFPTTTTAEDPLRLNRPRPLAAADDGRAATPNSPTPRTTSSSIETTYDISESQARASIQWLAELAIRESPRTFDGDKDWGDTKAVFSGIKLKREGMHLKTSRRQKDVRHGRWIKYELTLPPSSRTGSNTPDGIASKIHQVTKADGHWKIESSINTPMTFKARIERWNRGVQWYSLSIEGKLRVRMDASTRLAFLADYTEVPPALVIDPKIETATLHLEEFEVDRVSKIGGDVAEEWGELMEQTLLDIFIKKQNSKLTAKLNKSIDKHRDDLRLSMADWFADW